MCRRFYLDTNAIYSLANKLEEISRYDSVYISLLGMYEIISKISYRSEFQRRKTLISKIKNSNMKVYPYLPLECIAMAFKLDISKLDLIMSQKEQLWKMIITLIECTSYQDYEEKLRKIEININSILNDEKETKELKATEINKILLQNHRQMKEQEETRKKEPQYYRLTLDDLFKDESTENTKETIRQTLVYCLDICKITYDEEDINKLCENYNSELTSFFLGCSMYTFKRSFKGENVAKNDYIDLNHLLYLRNENDIIVSDDRIYDMTTIFQQRKTVDEFRKIFDI